MTGSQIGTRSAGRALGQARPDIQYLRDTGIHKAPMGAARRTLAFGPVGVVGAITPWNVPFYPPQRRQAPRRCGRLTPSCSKPAQPAREPGTELSRIVAGETDIPAQGVQRGGVQRQRGRRRAVGADPRST